MLPGGLYSKCPLAGGRAGRRTVDTILGIPNGRRPRVPTENENRHGSQEGKININNRVDVKTRGGLWFSAIADIRDCAKVLQIRDQLSTSVDVVVA